MLRRQRDMFETTDQPLTESELIALKRQINSPLLVRCLRTIEQLRGELTSLQHRASRSEPQRATAKRANR